MRYKLDRERIRTISVGDNEYECLDFTVNPQMTGGHGVQRLIASPDGRVLCVYGSYDDKLSLDRDTISAVSMALVEIASRSRHVPNVPLGSQ